MRGVVVQAALVEEALAPRVYLEPGLRTQVEERQIGEIRGVFAGEQSHAVEQHGAVGVVHLGAHPQAGLDSVAVCRRPDLDAIKPHGLGL